MACCGTNNVVSSPDAPIVLGESTDPTIYRVRSTINYAQMDPGQIYWVRGSQVLELIAGQVLVLVD